jgi:hypothetical protein
MSINQITPLLKDLSREELLELNKMIVQSIRDKTQDNCRKVSSQLSVGTQVSFMIPRGRNAGLHYMIIEKFNRAGTAVVGFECGSDGQKRLPAMRWTVASSLVTKK